MFQPPPWSGPPLHEVPVAFALDAVVARTGEVVVAVTGAHVHSTGLHLDVRMVARTGAVPGRDAFLLGPSAGDTARFGVAFADGRRTVYDAAAAPDEDPAIVLAGAGGCGAPEGARMRLWLWPLPPEGPLTFTLDWPDEGIAGAAVAVDGAPLRAAAARVVALWPDERPPLPPLEPGDQGWLAYVPR